MDRVGPIPTRSNSDADRQAHVQLAWRQFERELTRERMLVGIAKARTEGKYKGRAPTARAKGDKVRELRDTGVRPAEIARQVGISRTSVCRVLG